MFLSLVGILILALLGTLLETARYTACGNHAARTTRTAADALLTEYNRPLFDHYGLFFIESAGPSYEKEMAEYAADTMEAAGVGDMDFFQGELRKLSVREKVYVGDHRAEPLQKEVEERMKYRQIEKMWDRFTKKSEKVSSLESTAKEIEDNVNQQREEAKFDKELLSLMKLIDGISVSGGKITCEKKFIKMFVTGKKDSQNFGINNVKVWEKIRQRLCEDTLHWERADRLKLRSQVNDVLEITDRAISLRDKMRKAYPMAVKKRDGTDSMDTKMADFTDSLSVLDTNRRILYETGNILKEEITVEREEELKILWQDYDTAGIKFDYTGIDEKGGAVNPLDSLSASWKNGILNLVFEEPSTLSKSKVTNADHYADLSGVKEKKERDYSKSVSRLSDEKVSFSGVLGDLAGLGMSELCLDSYIEERFSRFSRPISDWKRALEYQQEYIVAGKSSDRENLESVLNRILLLRAVTNFVAIYQDESKKTEAYSAAAAVVGFTGMEPLIRFTQTLILIVWSIVEGLVDVAGILQGRNVPAIKSPANILTGFAQIFQITGKAIAARAKKFGKGTSKSFCYEDYLRLFLMGTDAGLRRYRIMDLIQWDMIQNKYPAFDFGSCVFSVSVSATYSFDSKFFRMYAIEKILGRDVREYTYCCEVKRGYL